MSSIVKLTRTPPFQICPILRWLDLASLSRLARTERRFHRLAADGQLLTDVRRATVHGDPEDGDADWGDLPRLEEAGAMTLLSLWPARRGEGSGFDGGTSRWLWKVLIRQMILQPLDDESKLQLMPR